MAYSFLPKRTSLPVVVPDLKLSSTSEDAQPHQSSQDAYPFPSLGTHRLALQHLQESSCYFGR
uniref:Uncharacterized protein n=1 Tax=Arundo donax TaxID=35708 RepID=A0A0A8ZAG4_ARUDO